MEATGFVLIYLHYYPSHAPNAVPTLLRVYPNVAKPDGVLNCQVLLQTPPEDGPRSVHVTYRVLFQTYERAGDHY